MDNLILAIGLDLPNTDYMQPYSQKLPITQVSFIPFNNVLHPFNTCHLFNNDWGMPHDIMQGLSSDTLNHIWQ